MKAVEPFYLAFGQNVRYHRILGGLSQTELGGRIGYKVSAMSYIENGRIRVSLHIAIEIAKALGVSLSDLLPGVFNRPVPLPVKARRPRKGGRIPK